MQHNEVATPPFIERSVGWLNCLLRKRPFPHEGAPTSGSPIKLQVLLRSEWRTPQGVEKVREILRTIGLIPTIGGAATISAEVDPKQFQHIFGVTVTETAPQPPRNNEFGMSAGHVSPDLEIPAALSDFVESISAASGHSYLQK
jgi:hypothetical protein